MLLCYCKAMHCILMHVFVKRDNQANHLTEKTLKATVIDVYGGKCLLNTRKIHNRVLLEFII